MPKDKIDLFMKMKRNGECVPRPISMIRAVKNDGLAMEILSAATAAAKDALAAYSSGVGGPPGQEGDAEVLC